MARPKGSKNKVKVLDGIDYAAQIAEKNTAAESITEEIATLSTNIAALNAEKKAKEAELKKINKEIVKLEKKKADADAKIAEAAKKAEAEDVLKKLLSSGVSADEILEKLK